MNIQCPICNTKNAFNQDNVAEFGERVICNNCKRTFLIKQKPSAYKPGQAIDKVMVANSNPHFCSAIKDFLTGRGFEVMIAKDGVEALQFLEMEIPQIAVVDVALPGMYGFEICDFIKNKEKLKDIKIILLASIYDKTRYKRMPSSIYGAADYIEMHHIPDQLVPKINKLLGKDANMAAYPVTMQTKEFETVIIEEDKFSEKIKDIAAKDIKVKRPEGSKTDKAQEEAVRLARIIISDIILYNQETVERGIREGNLLELLKDDIMEGQAYYAKRVPLEVRKNKAYLKNAFEELIDKIKKDIGV
ncbi:MAG: response regulator [Deltaproteobacteria bacterium]|nr:response regulator [Deltaproteobacteria bacterium]